MSLSKDCYKNGDINAFAKEMWMYHPKAGGHFLCSNRSGNEIAVALDSLYETLKEYSKHPRINRNIQAVIDAFMNNESKQNVEQEENPFCIIDPDDLPF